MRCKACDSIIYWTDYRKSIESALEGRFLDMDLCTRCNIFIEKATHSTQKEYVHGSCSSYSSCVKDTSYNEED